MAEGAEAFSQSGASSKRLSKSKAAELVCPAACCLTRRLIQRLRVSAVRRHRETRHHRREIHHRRLEPRAKLARAMLLRAMPWYGKVWLGTSAERLYALLQHDLR